MKKAATLFILSVAVFITACAQKQMYKKCLHLLKVLLQKPIPHA